MTKDEKIKRLDVQTWGKILKLKKMYLGSGVPNDLYYEERNKIMREYFKEKEKIREE